MAAKLKRTFFCTSCGYETPKWLGKCPACGEWNTITEHVVAKESTTSSARLVSVPKAQPQRVQDITEQTTHRIDTGLKELNRVLGGAVGVVYGFVGAWLLSIVFVLLFPKLFGMSVEGITGGLMGVTEWFYTDFFLSQLLGLTL
jgi:hypothetical protein